MFICALFFIAMAMVETWNMDCDSRRFYIYVIGAHIFIWNYNSQFIVIVYDMLKLSKSLSVHMYLVYKVLIRWGIKFNIVLCTSDRQDVIYYQAVSMFICKDTQDGISIAFLMF